MEYLKKMGIKIKNKKLLESALTHSSHSNEHNCENYERLEYLGDAILEAATSDYLFLNTNFSEGEMTKTRANFVCEKALATYSKDLGIDKYIRLGQGQMHFLNDTIIADVFEAVAAAIYLDQGWDVVKKYLMDLMVPYINKGCDFNTDYKTKLQEAVQTSKKSLEYVLVREFGNSHDKTFEMAVKIDNIIYGKGIGKSKKEAEQNAALDALNKSAVK